MYLILLILLIILSLIYFINYHPIQDSISTGSYEYSTIIENAIGNTKENQTIKNIKDQIVENTKEDQLIENTKEDQLIENTKKENHSQIDEIDNNSFLRWKIMIHDHNLNGYNFI